MKKILVVDDCAFFRTHMSNVLQTHQYQVVTAQNGAECLDAVRRDKPDLVLLDVEMPVLNGFEACRILRESESSHLMPIIMVTSLDRMEDKLTGLELGADDYITKPFNQRELLSRIRNTLRRVERNRLANPLTGLPGNLEIQREIDGRIARNVPYAVIYMDIDSFKCFNDVYGFFTGDKAIQLTGDIACQAVDAHGGREDFVGHIGGDDFVAITTPGRVDNMCQAIIEEFDRRVPGLYSEQDRRRGYIAALNRKGVAERFPIMTLSLSVVSSQNRRFTSHLEVSSVAAELKTLLKQMDGSHYMVDRRKSFPVPADGPVQEAERRSRKQAAPEHAKPAESMLRETVKEELSVGQ